jgi:sulfur-oxidizing protein SoxZ
MARALLNVPPTAKRGDMIEIKTLIAHPMESGFRVGTNGIMIPRDIITLFRCTYNGAEICRADLSPAIAVNPFISFFTVATESGRLEIQLDRGQRVLADRNRRTRSRMRGVLALVVAGLALASAAATATDVAPGQRRSGYELMRRELRSMQDDDSANPGILSVLDGAALWNRAAGAPGSPAPPATAMRRRAWRASPRATCIRRGAGAAGRSRTEHQSLLRRTSKGGGAAVREQGPVGARRLFCRRPLKLVGGV